MSKILSRSLKIWTKNELKLLRLILENRSIEDMKPLFNNERSLKMYLRSVFMYYQSIKKPEQKEVIESFFNKKTVMDYIKYKSFNTVSKTYLKDIRHKKLL